MLALHKCASLGTSQSSQEKLRSHENYVVDDNLSFSHGGFTNHPYCASYDYTVSIFLFCNVKLFYVFWAYLRFSIAASNIHCPLLRCALCIRSSERKKIKLTTSLSSWKMAYQFPLQLFMRFVSFYQLFLLQVAFSMVPITEKFTLQPDSELKTGPDRYEAASLESCAALCNVKGHNCTTFEYNSVLGVCSLSSTQAATLLNPTKIWTGSFVFLQG